MLLAIRSDDFFDVPIFSPKMLSQSHETFVEENRWSWGVLSRNDSLIFGFIGPDPALCNNYGSSVQTKSKGTWRCFAGLSLAS